jgi:hypothetical protein
MKKLLIVLLSFGLTFGASAQVKVGGSARYVRPRVAVVNVVPVMPYSGFGYYGYSPFYSRFYSPFYDPFFGPTRFQSAPSKLDLQIEDIKNEFQYKISTVRNDKSLTKDERKQQIRELRHSREDAIIEAKKSYYSKNDSRSNS